MNIAHIEDFFHPDAGYQLNILSKYQVKQGHSVTIVTPEMRKIPDRLKSFFGYSDITELDEAFTLRTGAKIIRVPMFIYYSGRAIYTMKLFSVIGRIKPDILYIHGNSSFAGIVYTLLYWKLNHALILDTHMLDMATSNTYSGLFHWIYRKLIKPIIVRNNIKIIRLVYDDFVINKLGIPARLSPVISFGTDTMQFHPDPGKREKIRSELKLLSDDFVVLYMGKLTEDKGVLLLAEAIRAKFFTPRRIIFAIIGNVSSDYGEKVEKELNLSDNRILRFPTQKYSDLPLFYCMADIAVFPRHCSLSFFDAQACGVPVVLEDNSINIARVTQNNGLIFKSGDSNDLRDKILLLAELSPVNFQSMKDASIAFISENNLDYEKIADQYDSILNDSYNLYKTSIS